MLSAKEVFNMATANGGKASHISKLGEIKVGAPADFNIIDGNHFSIQSSNPEVMVNHIVYSMNPGAIVDTVINGKYVKKDGRITMDLEKQYKESLNYLKNTFKV